MKKCLFGTIAAFLLKGPLASADTVFTDTPSIWGLFGLDVPNGRKDHRYFTNTRGGKNLDSGLEVFTQPKEGS